MTSRLSARLSSAARRCVFIAPVRRFCLHLPPRRVMNVMTAAGGQETQMTFTIDSENNITAFAIRQEAGGVESFSSQEDLASLAANWPASRLVEVWNSIPGFVAVKRFTDRKTAVARIWKAVQSLNGGRESEATLDARK